MTCLAPILVKKDCVLYADDAITSHCTSWQQCTTQSLTNLIIGFSKQGDTQDSKNMLLGKNTPMISMC